MLAPKTVLLLTVVGLLNLSTAAADSAGIVEMVNGLAYGGIPYGSVTGMVAKYPGLMRPQINSLPIGQLNGFRAPQPVVVGSNFRGGLVGAQPQAVRIYNIPRVVNTIGHIRY